MSKWIDKFLKKECQNRTDRTDKPKDKGHLSVLSVPPQGLLDKNSLYPFEERIAIAHYDGHQSITQAQRIAYLDDFVDVLRTLPHKKGHEGDWLKQRINRAQEWLKQHGLEQPE